MTSEYKVEVTAVTALAEGIKAWELRACGADDLPPFTAGAHIDVKLANGMMRSYSLCNDPAERGRYVIAVNKDATGKGGSKFIHETLGVGDTLVISAPRNNFELAEDVPLSVFIAGGIGITPIRAMIHRLERLGTPWRLHYSTRRRANCAFKDELDRLEREQAGRVFLNFDHEDGGAPIDLAALVGSLPNNAHLYCCGPLPMLQAFEGAAKSAGVAAGRVHVEYFAAREEAASEGGFVLELARSGRSFNVVKGKTILQTLMDNDIDVQFSCMDGICGTCETRVIEGVPDHRDSILNEEERAANETMMICCSGCKGGKLVLDI